MSGMSGNGRSGNGANGHGALASHLAELEFFDGLRAAEAVQVLRLSRQRLFAPEEVVVQQDQPGDALYVLTAGSVQVRRYLPGGAYRRLAILPAGAAIGEMELLSGRPYYASVVAAEPGAAIVLPRQAFQDALATNASWANKLLLRITSTLSRRLEDTNCRVVETLEALDSAITPSISELERLRDHLSTQWSF